MRAAVSGGVEGTPERLIELTLAAPLPSGELARLGRELALAAGALVHCDVAGVPAELASVDALARLQLIASRTGGAIHLRRASPELLELIAWMGLGEVLDE